ncbi:MAG: hypothetical protein ACRDUY_17020 [Nitriliruptorales bacterium]
MPVQDDAREIELVRLFNLTVPEERQRADIDAYLRMGEREFPFELKSTTGRSISTVRDFGPDHIAKWQGIHWVFGFYDRAGIRLLHCHYASPDDMRPWIDEKAEYVRPDVVLADHAPDLVTASMLHESLGAKAQYTLDDARRIHKRQYTTDEYRARMDLEDGYSPGRMLEILQDRCEHVIKRGSTLNNPHIPGSYFEGWERITENHAIRLRELVAEFARRLP